MRASRHIYTSIICQFLLQFWKNCFLILVIYVFTHCHAFLSVESSMSYCFLSGSFVILKLWEQFREKMICEKSSPKNNNIWIKVLEEKRNFKHYYVIGASYSLLHFLSKQSLVIIFALASNQFISCLTLKVKFMTRGQSSTIFPSTITQKKRKKKLQEMPKISCFFYLQSLTWV